jgi:recombination DNA repair RAD52 pathway protein
MSLTNEQINELLKPINQERVFRDAHGFAYVEAWDVRRTMNAVFGFGEWSADVQRMEIISEREVTMKNGKTGWNVVYRAQCVLRLGDMFGASASYTEWAAGAATNPTYSEAHDQAIKTAESQAFKRCAVNLGDQFGLSLYNDGSTDATVLEIVGQEHADSGMVDTWLVNLKEAVNMDDLDAVAIQIRGADISGMDRRTLLTAFMGTKTRLTTNATV